MLIIWVCKIGLIVTNVCIIGFGIALGYAGLTYANEVYVPPGMDDDGLIPVGITAMGFFGITAAGVAIIGIVALNVKGKRHKIFLAFVYGFLSLSLLIFGFSIPIVRAAGVRQLRNMYDRCCVDFEVCCVNDPDLMKNMDELHNKYECCGYDGPSYFADLEKVTYPNSCCPQKAHKGFTSCDADNSYTVACKTKINEELRPYLLVLEVTCLIPAILCGLVTLCISVMAYFDIDMDK